jgi:integrase
MELTYLKCEKAKPGAKPYCMTDRLGLFLLVTPSGGKLWRWKYRFENKQKQIALGKFPDVSLLEARKQHLNARTLLAQHIDPMALRKEDKQQKKAQAIEEEKAAALTFEALAKQWLSWWKNDRKPRYAIQMKSRLEDNLFPVFGCKPAAEISRVEIIQLIQTIDARGARDIARRMLQVITQIYEHGLDLGLLEINPAAGIKPHRIVSRILETHQAHLPIAEIPGLLNDMQNYSGSTQTCMAMEMLSLTFVRTGELIGARWEEINWAEKQWRIPASRMKMKRVHIVPLARQTLDLLQKLNALTGETEWLFPGSNSRAVTMSNNTILQALERMGYKGRMTGHGWRSVASTWLHEHHFAHEHIELQLAHAKEDKVSAAYNFALYLDDRAAMMQAWADALDKMREQGEHRLKIVA